MAGDDGAGNTPAGLTHTVGGPTTVSVHDDADVPGHALARYVEADRLAGGVGHRRRTGIPRHRAARPCAQDPL